jgi:hypothetical protein
MLFESSTNNEFRTYDNSFLYTYGIVVGTKFTNSTASTLGSQILMGGLSLLNLVFFGFIASIITISVEIRVLERGSGRKL